MKRPRFRHVFIVLGSLLVGAGMFGLNVDRGAAVALLVSALSSVVWLAAAAHVVRKGLFDYLDMQRLMDRAAESPLGAAQVFQAIVQLMIAVVLAGAWLLTHASPHPKSLQHAATIKAEIAEHWAELPWPHYVPGLIEHESCLSLTHPRCWEPTSRLKSAREEGAGLGQLTRAWNPDGTLRFDALAELRSRHAVLSGLSWDTIYSRPDLQIRALVVMSAETWRAFAGVPDFLERLAMTDAAYNGGAAGVRRERNSCGLTAGCDPQRWFGHVEHHCLKSRRPLYGGRSACDINRHHVADVLHARMPKYRRLLA